jgi:hypothetical protein
LVEQAQPCFEAISSKEKVGLWQRKTWFVTKEKKKKKT